MLVLATLILLTGLEDGGSYTCTSMHVYYVSLRASLANIV